MNKSRKTKSDGKVYSSSSMYVGMDVHKNYLQIAVVDAKGNLLENSRVDNDIAKIGEFFERSNLIDENSNVVMESSCVWYGIYEYLTKNKHLNQVSLSNPIKTKAIASAKIKTDKIDAVQLANLLRGGYIAECYVPETDIIRLREIVRHRSSLVRLRSKMKNKIHGIMLMKGIKILDHHPFSIKYKQKLRQLHDYRINTYLRLIENIELEIKEVSRNIILLAKKDKATRLLMTIPGVGYYSALLIISEIGTINRFPDSYHLCSYAGLVPSTHSSGGVTYHGNITKTGSKYLRWIMIECARSHVRYSKDSNITKFYERLVKKKGSSKAAVATASKLLKVVYWIMKEGREYHHDDNNTNNNNKGYCLRKVE